jgi:two-component system, OmpR family, sensor kinase
MWATASARERWLIPVWVAFASVNTVLMYLMPGAETIPFHFVWVSTAVVYGLRPWSLRRMWIACAVITVVTGIPLVRGAQTGTTGWQETSEIPLMALLFLVMVWHVRRRMAATAEACRLAEVERAGREAQRRFVRFASHELRTPITVARGFTELLRKEHAEIGADPDISVVLDELDKLEGVAARLLALAASEDVPVHVEDVDLATLLERTARRRRTSQLGRRVRRHLGAGGPDASRGRDRQRAGERRPAHQRRRLGHPARRRTRRRGPARGRR